MSNRDGQEVKIIGEEKVMELRGQVIGNNF